MSEFGVNKRKALIIGISDYSKLESLEFCKNDAQDLYDNLSTLGYEIKDGKPIIGKVDGNRLRMEIQRFFLDLNNKPDDLLLFYYSGHGIFDTRDNKQYMATSDINPEEPFYEGFPFEDFGNILSSNRCISKRIVIILDSCYSGAAKINDKTFVSMGKTTDYQQAKVEASLAKESIKEFSQLKQGQGIYILSASQATQEAYALRRGKNSLFTHYLIEGLKGNAGSVDNEGNVTPQSLHGYIYNKITNLPAGKRPEQTPLVRTKESGTVVLFHYPNLIKKNYESIEPIDLFTKNMKEGNDYLSQAKYEEAINCYNEAIRLKPENANAWTNKGKAFFEMKRIKEANYCYDMAIKLDNTYTPAWINKSKIKKNPLLLLISSIAVIIAISYLLPFPLSLFGIISGIMLIVWYSFRNQIKIAKKVRELRSKQNDKEGDAEEINRTIISYTLKRLWTIERLPLITVLVTSICVLSVLLIAIIYSYSHSELLVYENPSYGVKITYPSDWTFTNTIGSVSFFAPGEGISNLAIGVRELQSDEIDLAEEENDTQILLKNRGATILDSNNVSTLSGYPAFNISYYYSFGNEAIISTVLGTVVDNKAYIIQYETDPKNDKILPITLGMIKSFEIIN